MQTTTDERQMEHVSGFRFLEYILDESGREKVKYYCKVINNRKVAGAIRLPVNAVDFRFELVRLMQKDCLYQL